ncbi:diguanylate cyclase [Caldicellulosiruptor changbaiensis]|uniref:Diguanylate cyclase n=1 Tax=Caldicellulosiruptor changbaiensis TaxID=1222016 RepID=A0A3T0D3X8_9FIRM|nr:diguanylate cyclase [Caldicellulosiruptor changbaiensis]AZT89510.1 diguanylate cyclase [Caldicellulosiruptor changbaiensis]
MTKKGFFDAENIQLFQTFAHQAAAALENANLYEKSTRRLQHIQALRKIDMAINGSIDPRVASTVALQETIKELNVDAAAIFRLNPYIQKLEFVAGYGFYTDTIEEISLSSKKSFAGRAVLERKTIYIPDIEKEDEDIAKDLFRVEGFKAYCVVPLIAKGRVLGVLEVFMRNPRIVNNEWREFLETLAGQIAIAIDNAELFNNLQRSNIELLKAYDETIEALSYALDLKDKETEGHSQRVTELTLSIAKEIGIPEEQLIHIKRGALLHDIGKMGIPDSILLKPGKLSDEEWEIMKMHPVYAYQMLSHIEYLRPALDIPYCHHEKWDGSGYPRGLKGKEIPLAARIFAIVDVFDALTNDRPYRKAIIYKIELGFIGLREGDKVKIAQAKGEYGQLLAGKEWSMVHPVIEKIFLTVEPSFLDINELKTLDGFIDLEADVGNKIMIYPLWTSIGAVGLLGIMFSPDSIDENDNKNLQIYVNFAAIALANAKIVSRLEKEAETDFLTGFFNKRTIQNILISELERAIRYRLPLAVIFLDIDDFKAYNDTFGHVAGDVMVQKTAEIIKNSIRTVDIAGRFGGEEFVIILPGTDEEGAIAVAERIRKAIESYPFPHRRVTASLGITLARSGDSVESLLERADRALYQAKREGKNRCCLA